MFKDLLEEYHYLQISVYGRCGYPQSKHCFVSHFIDCIRDWGVPWGISTSKYEGIIIFFYTLKIYYNINLGLSMILRAKLKYTNKKKVNASVSKILIEQRALLESDSSDIPVSEQYIRDGQQQVKAKGYTDLVRYIYYISSVCIRYSY